MSPPATLPGAPDRASVAGKQPPIDATTDLLIIGAGPAGISAALAAAGRSAHVTLVDENPISLEGMGHEVPLHFGGRMAATLSNRNAVLERILEATPQLAAALEAGVDVRLGTAAWGIFPQHPTAAWLDGPVAGLADADNVYLMRFKQVIVATGRRDMGLAFAGWQRPGVMGASAAYRLAKIYDALDSRVAVLIGSDTEALQIATALAEVGIRIEAIVEQSATIAGSPQLLAGLAERGTRVFTRHVVQEAHGDSFGVTSVKIVAIDDGGHHLSGETANLSCDTVLLGVGAIPTIELIEACGCAVRFQAERGGHVAVIDECQRTSLPFVYVAGDCAGIWQSKTLFDPVAQREGRIAARAALRALGLELETAMLEVPVAPETAFSPDLPARDICAARLCWARASILESPVRPYVCQCEEVTATEILSLQPPRYLEWNRATVRQAVSDLYEPGCDGIPGPDVVKRLTRAGMGPCQGRRCREQIAALVAIDAGVGLSDVRLATYRTPVRPLTLAQLATLPEAPSMNAHWDSWFGMPSQWVPFWNAAGSYTVATRNLNDPVGGE
jgi:thioredoxin reductase